MEDPTTGGPAPESEFVPKIREDLEEPQSEVMEDPAEDEIRKLKEARAAEHRWNAEQREIERQERKERRERAEQQERKERRERAEQARVIPNLDVAFPRRRPRG